jgi:hypothetical protein
LALDIDPSALDESGYVAATAYDTPALHLYGNASMPLHVSTDMSGVTLTVKDATPEQLKTFRDSIHQIEQQNQTAAKN